MTPTQKQLFNKLLGYAIIAVVVIGVVYLAVRGLGVMWGSIAAGIGSIFGLAGLRRVENEAKREAESIRARGGRAVADDVEQRLRKRRRSVDR
jgi:hypothetical protein